MVSHPPVITQATRPAYESGPTFSNISCNIIKEPLPEIALKNMRGSSCAGTSNTVRTGASNISIKLRIPDEVRLFMAINMPMRKGRISTAVFRPFFAPSMK